MSAIWSGHIAFGQVSLPVQLHPATQESRPRLHEVHIGCGGTVRHRRVCEAEEREVEPSEIGHGWRAPDGRTVVLREEDLQALPLPTRRVIEVLGFVPDGDVDPTLYARPYYVAPSGSAADRPYALLVEALAGAGQLAVCKVAIGSRERLAVLRPHRGILVCHTLVWPEEIREPGDWAPSAPVSDQELRMAEVFMEQMAGVDVEQLRDDYGAALEQLVSEGAQHLPELQEPETPGDLLAALKASIQKARDC